MYKVCHMTSAHESTDVRIFHKECTSIAQNNEYEVYLVACGNSRRENGVKVIGGGQMPNSRLKRMLFFSKRIFNISKDLDADVYHLHDPELLIYGLKLKKLGKKVIFDSHENVYEQIKIKSYLPKFIRAFIAKLYLLYETKICMKIDAVIVADSEHDNNFFENRCRQITFIDNTPKRKEIYDKFTTTECVKNNSVSCVGSLTEERGIEFLIKGCYLAGVKLILAGYFSPDSFFEKVKKMKEFECVDYKGYCSRKEVIEIFKETRIGASTILNLGQYDKAHNLPTKVYEYMAAGIPVIMNDFPFGKIQNDKYDFGILVNPKNPEEIASAIIKLQDDVLYSKYSENARKAADDVFNWEVEQEKLLSLYAKIM